MIKFQWKGPTIVGFASIGREVKPDEEFDVPEHLALGFAEHGHCVCLEPDKLAPLRAAAEAAQAALDDARDAAGLVYAHPVAAAAAAERAAARAAQAPPTAAAPAVDEPLLAEPEPDPAPAPAPKRSKTDPATSATAK